MQGRYNLCYVVFFLSSCATWVGCGCFCSSMFIFCLGSWDFFISECNDRTVDMKESFFVGDAAGRPKDWQKGT